MDDDFPVPELPPKNAVHVWMIELDSSLRAGASVDDWLSADERERAERLVYARDTRRFKMGRAMLRLGLAWYLRTSPGTVRLTIGRFGKPRLAEGPALYFNVTHSAGLGLIAFTTAGEVGIDVEAAERAADAMEIAAAYFTRQEAAMIESAGAPHEQASIFLRLWTRKEAVLKAAGCGIYLGLDTVDVSQAPMTLIRMSGAPDQDADSLWRVRDLALREGFDGAVAGPPGEWSIRKWAIGYEDLIDHFATRFPGVL